MFKNLLLVAGGAVAIAILIKFLCDQKCSSSELERVNLNDLLDDECISDNLTPGILKEWFKKYNKDDRYTNIVILPKKENLEKYNISKMIDEVSEKSVFQIIFDEYENKILRFRLISFNTINSKLEKILYDSNGILIVEEA